MNAKHSSKTRYGYGNNACFDAGLFNNQASSLRYTGAPDDMYHDTVCITIIVKFVQKWPYATHRAGVRSANRYNVIPPDLTLPVKICAPNIVFHASNMVKRSVPEKTTRNAVHTC